MRLLPALALAVLASTAALAEPVTSPGVIAHPDWSAGYEAGYMEVCDVTPAERAAWASPVATRGPRIDRAEYLSGFMTAHEDAESYDEAGFDRVEFCADVHP